MSARPDFRTHMRRATGGTLLVPSLAERVAGAGGFIAFSNVSPGAAYFLDPEHFGHVYHRAGSYAPGGGRIGSDDALNVSHDAAGDWAMTQRFCREVLGDRRPAVAFLWLCDPDHTLHGVPLGSPAHADALRGAERCVAEVLRTVARLRAEGDEILLLIGSDHGQETIGDGVDLEDWLAAHGLEGALAAGDVAMAGQGTAALLYATARGRAGLLGVLDEMRQEPWAADVVIGESLADRGFAARGGVVAAVNMARQDEANPYGVPRPALGGCRGGQACAHRQRATWRLGTGRDAAVPDGKRRRPLVGNGGAADQPRRHRAHHRGLSRTFH